MILSEVLRKAGDVLRRQGFGQGFKSDRGTGPVCLRGAIGIAAQCDPYADNWIGFLDMVTSGEETGIVAWNDNHARTATEAQIALDAAYVLALQEEGIEPEDVLR